MMKYIRLLFVVVAIMVVGTGVFSPTPASADPYWSCLDLTIMCWIDCDGQGGYCKPGQWVSCQVGENPDPGMCEMQAGHTYACWGGCNPEDYPAN